jgi:excinuclease UvrABC ATPase subunit
MWLYDVGCEGGDADGYVIVQEAPEFVKRASEIFVRLDRGGG